MISRIIEQKIRNKLHKGKAILILGPRQTGKTTLAELISPTEQKDTIWLSGDDINDRMNLENRPLASLKTLIGDKKFLLIDEAQRIQNIGLTIKLIVDKIKTVQVIATGSSALELSNQMNEPLTGRKFEFLLLPLSFKELAQNTNVFEETNHLENRLIFGSYPEIVNNPGQEKELLSLLSESYLYKDLLTVEKIKKPSLLVTLLKALALQMGSEVSYNEIGQLIGADKETVERYMDALEKAFIIYRLPSLSRNIRNELKKSKKVYFYDNGIRNAILGNFSPLALRQDKGALFENYLISERLKILQYEGVLPHRYFWRTTQQQEIDYIEEYDGNIDIYEFKWTSTKKISFSSTFLNNYQVNNKQLIHSQNYFEWLMGK